MLPEAGCWEAYKWWTESFWSPVKNFRIKRRTTDSKPWSFQREV